MGDPLQTVTTALSQIFNDVQTRRTEIEEDFIHPLKLLPKSDINGLDLTHDQCVQDVQKAVGKLFAPGVSFEGAGADAVATLLGSYFEHENTLNNYETQSVSTYITQMEQLCQSTVNDMQPHLDALQGATMSNPFVQDILHFWSDFFQKGPLAAAEDLQIGPWTIGDILHGHPSNSPVLQAGQVQMPQQLPPQSTSPISAPVAGGFWEWIGATLLAVGAVAVVVVNIITEIIKGLAIDWHMSALGFALFHWEQQMNDIHNHVLQQNKDSSLPANAQNTMRISTKNDQAIFMLKTRAGVPDPNLNPNQQKLAQDLFNKYDALYPGVLTLAEVQYLVAAFPANVVERKIQMLIALKQQFPTLPPGYLAYFVLQGLPQAVIVQDIQWLQNAQQNAQGNSGNIYYMKGTVFSNPVVDLVTAETFRFIFQEATDLRRWYREIVQSGVYYMNIPEYNGLPGAAKTYLEKTYFYRSQLRGYDPNAPNAKLPKGYKGPGLFGTAVQELVKQRIFASSWYKQYINKYGAGSFIVDSGPGLRPDIKVRLPDGRWAVWDYTTFDQRDTKKKYNTFPFNIVLIHNGPYGGPEI